MVPSAHEQQRRDLGRLLCRLLCALFALIGVVPLMAGALVRSPSVEAWAARETARILRDNLGVEASYQVSLEVVPLRLSISELRVPGSDGKGPALSARQISVTPRVFSLLAGKLDVGDIEVERPEVRLVVREGKLQNLRYQLEPSTGGAVRSERAPFASLAITEAKLNLKYDDVSLESGLVDIDVLAETGPVFEVAVRLAEGGLTRRRPLQADGGAPGTAVDEDAICRLDLRLSSRPEALTLRRFSLLGVADDSTAIGTKPKCSAATDENDPARIATRISGLRVELADEHPVTLSGHVMLQIPARLGNRGLTDLPFEGSLAFAGDVSYDARERLPDISGRLRGMGLKLDGIVLANSLDATLEVGGDHVHFPKAEVSYADASVSIESVRIEPFKPGAPISSELVDIRHMTFPGLMRDLDVTPNTIVRWDLDRAIVKRVRGQLLPFVLNADLNAETSDFEVTHGAWHDPKRVHILGVPKATVRGQLRFGLDAFELLNTHANFGNSHVFVKDVFVGYEDELRLSVPAGSKLDLRDISPLASIPMAGVAEIDASMKGTSPDVLLSGAVKIHNFVFGGFPLGDIQSAQYRFVPLKLELSDVQAKKQNSPYRARSAHLDFDTDATVVVDALVDSPSLDVRDFLSMWNFGDDPRWTHLKGHGQTVAKLHYVLGGSQDRCGGGNLKVTGSASFDRLEAFEEFYDSANTEFDFHWTDFDATYRGFSLDIPTFNVSKGPGTLAGSFQIKPGARIHGKLVGSGVPISKINALGERVRAVEGEVTSAVGEMTGSLDAVEIEASASLSELKLGRHSLPPSAFSVRHEPVHKPSQSLGTTRCGQPIAPAFDRARYDKDELEGIFHMTGQLFGGQARFTDLTLTSQRAKVWKGKTEFDDFNLAAVLELFAPGSQPGFQGKLSGAVEIARYPLDDPTRADLRLSLTGFEASQAGLQAKLAAPKSALTLRRQKLTLENLALGITTPQGQSGVFDVRGALSGLGRAPEVDAELRLRPTDLSAFAALIPNAESAKGQVNAKLSVSGPLEAPNVRGGLTIKKGEVVLKGLKSPISDLNVEVQVDPSQIRVVEGVARIGNGRLLLRGQAPIQGTNIGTARADLEVKGLALSLEDGIRATVDSKLSAVYPIQDGAQALPSVSGEVMVTSFDYTRPMSMTADLSSFAKRGQRTKVDAYDPEADVVEFDVQLRSQRPLHIQNELLETDLVVDNSGLRLKGTNQRFGMLGRLKLKPGGQITLRNHEFEIRQGWVRFDDLNQIAPEVDVTATTDYRRFEDSSTQEAPNAGGVSTGGVGSSSLGGQWRINLHAHGDPENLKIDLTSTPNLPQDDIFLLLTVGLTRAELDQNRSAAVGSSVALEALGTLSGADRAVKDAVPVIDNASMGSAYNPKSGRTEPTITIGKRLAEKLRAQVTTGLSDSSKVESSLRWQMNQQVSVEGSYGNVNDISSSSLGNLGADIRWRLEFD